MSCDSRRGTESSSPSCDYETSCSMNITLMKQSESLSESARVVYEHMPGRFSENLKIPDNCIESFSIGTKPFMLLVA